MLNKFHFFFSYNFPSIFWGNGLIISVVSSEPWYISRSGDAFLLEYCEILEAWEGRPDHLRMSKALILGLSLSLGNLITGTIGLGPEWPCVWMPSCCLLLPQLFQFSVFAELTLNHSRGVIKSLLIAPLGHKQNAQLERCFTPGR